MTWDELVTVGRIARPHGNRGQVIVDSETDFPEERFKAGAVLLFRRGPQAEVEPLTITAVRFHRGRPIIALEGVETINAAEELAGGELRIRPDALRTLPAGSFYRHDLVGCAVETPDGLPIGTVAGIEGAGGSSRLVVHGRSGGEILIPMTEAIVVGVHVMERKIVVQPLEGLLDLNATRKQRF